MDINDQSIEATRPTLDMRVSVDASSARSTATGFLIQDATGVTVTVVLASGESAAVQVARVKGGALRVICAGEVERDNKPIHAKADGPGYTGLTVWPTKDSR